MTASGPEPQGFSALRFAGQDGRKVHPRVARHWAVIAVQSANPLAESIKSAFAVPHGLAIILLVALFWCVHLIDRMWGRLLLLHVGTISSGFFSRVK